MRIAILGTRGIPARYGGFETFAEELSCRLVKRGHAVTVFGRYILGGGKNNAMEAAQGHHSGVRLAYAPTVSHKYLETPLHALSSFLLLKRKEFDVALLCNAANSPFTWIGSLKGLPIVTNVDGIERLRSKWNFIGKLWYRLGEVCAVAFSKRIVADADLIARYYSDFFGIQACVIRYGAEEINLPPGDVLKRFGLSAGRYLLFVSRLEPENNALGVIEAYRRGKQLSAGVNMPLVIVGDAPYASQYRGRLHARADQSVIFTGFQFGDAYRELRSNCYLAIQATEVGGTHPALVESMAHGNCIIANGVPEHFEVLGAAGVYYQRNDFDELAARMAYLADRPAIAREYGELARERAARFFSWDKITLQYERLFEEVAGRSL